MAKQSWGGDRPAVAIEADSDAGRARCARVVDAIGGRIVDADAADLVLIDFGFAPAETIERRISMLADRNISSQLLLAVPLDCVNAADAALAGTGATLLCGPDEAELAAALALAARPAAALVREDVADHAERFRRLAEDVGRVGRALTRLSQAGIAGEQTPVWDTLAAAADEPAPLDPARIREVIRLRKLRSRFFEPSLFADPAWDIFLDLMAAQLEGPEVSVSSLCIASEVPPSTGLRWIGALTERGLLVRRADPADRRRVHVELADSVAAAMTRYFAAIQAASPPVI